LKHQGEKMALSVFADIVLAAVSTVVPSGTVTLEDELGYFDGSVEKALKAGALSGVTSRRKADGRTTAADLCRQAAERLLSATGTPREDIDCLLFMSQNPDYPLPASASLLQHALGLSSRCAAMDMNSGCAGFVHGLWVLGALLASGACRKALLLVGDTPARFLDAANRVTAPLFGDAGSAALIESRPGAGSLSFLPGNDGAAHEALIIPGGGSRLPHRADEDPESGYNKVVTDPGGNPWTLGNYGQLWMEGMAVFSFGVGVIPGHIRRHLSLAGMKAEGLDLLLLHQANKLMLETIGKKLGLPREKTPLTALLKYGNLGAASLPALLCEELSGRPGPENVCLCGFGAGLSWSSCLLSLKEITALPVAEYEEAEEAPTRDDLIAAWHERFAHAGR
jgi:3-oxoacyl-[acyl-carrier-protein] synthase-3